MVVTVYEIPSLVALVFKLVLLGYAVRSRAKTSLTFVFTVMLVVLSLFNLVELAGLGYIATRGYDPRIADLFGFAYIALIIAAIALQVHLSLLLSFDGVPHGNRRGLLLVVALYAPAFALECLLLFTDKIVFGFKPFLYTVLRDPGPWYFLFETYLVVYFSAALVNLVYGARTSRPTSARVRNRLWLLALSPTALLFIYLIFANHFGWTKLTSTFYGPMAMTFFLVVTTYATYQYRLFDIEFYIPWSKVRKRKTAFYRRIQATIGEIADSRSVKHILDALGEVLRCQVALIGGPRPLLALVTGPQPDGGQPTLAEFPREALENVKHIVIANEIADAQPQLHALMKRHNVGAIVPFNRHSAMAAHWMLLGEHFSDQVYTPLDFKVVEALFDRIAERFLDDLLLLRAQLTEVTDDLRDYKRRLALAWQELGSLRRKVTVLEQDNTRLREANAELRRQQFTVVKSGLPEPIASGKQTLDQHIAQTEAAIVCAALRSCKGDKNKAARLLGIRRNNLHYLIERHGLEPKDCAH